MNWLGLADDGSLLVADAGEALTGGIALMPEAPRYHAYSAAAGRVGFTRIGPDDNGDDRFRMSFASSPIGESSNLEALAESLDAHFGREPGDTVYLVDAGQSLVKTLRCDKYVAAVAELTDALERQGRWNFIAWTLFALCVIAFVASAFAAMPLFGLAVFALTALLYLAIVLTGLQNECEGAVVCLVVLVLCLLLIPAVQRARESHIESPRDGQHGSARSIEFTSE